ncbi:hypothetical protein [Niallia sp. 03133]|uniref:hypothetical protein n=1 Tax=Niallia sp. 03133 TaxID=3458060 RepID=UPI004044A448
MGNEVTQNKKRKLLINKLICFGNETLAVLNSLSLHELQEKYHQYEVFAHPHDGSGSLIWRKRK